MKTPVHIHATQLGNMKSLGPEILKKSLVRKKRQTQRLLPKSAARPCSVQLAARLSANDLVAVCENRKLHECLQVYIL